MTVIAKNVLFSAVKFKNCLCLMAVFCDNGYKTDNNIWMPCHYEVRR